MDCSRAYVFFISMKRFNDKLIKGQIVKVSKSLTSGCFFVNHEFEQWVLNFIHSSILHLFSNLNYNLFSFFSQTLYFPWYIFKFFAGFEKNNNFLVLISSSPVYDIEVHVVEFWVQRNCEITKSNGGKSHHPIINSVE